MTYSDIQALIEAHHAALDTRIKEVANRLDDALIRASQLLRAEPDNATYQAQYAQIDAERESIIQQQQRLQRQLWQTYYDLLSHPIRDTASIKKLADELYDYLMPNLYGQHDTTAERQQEAQYPVLILVRHLRHKHLKLKQAITYKGKQIPAGALVTYTEVHPASGMGFKTVDTHLFISERAKIQGKPIVALLAAVD